MMVRRLLFVGLCGRLVAACVVVPSTIGFSTPSPAPTAGTELGFNAFLAGGSHIVHGGGGLSLARRSGSLGLSASLWGAGAWGPVGATGAHFELAVPVLGEATTRATDAQQPATDRTYYLLVGAGFGASFRHDDERCEGFFEQTCSDLPPGLWRLVHPQASIGFLASPSRGETGGFWGFRLGAGAPALRNDVQTTWSWHGSLVFSGGGGWRWRNGDAGFIDLQLEPFAALQLGKEGSDGGLVGLQLSMTVATVFGDAPSAEP